MLPEPTPEPVTPDAWQTGFALIVVIWLAVLLSIMAAAFTSAVKSRIRTAAAKTETARAGALAEAGIRLAAMDLIAKPDGRDRPPRVVIGAPAVVCSAGPGEIMSMQIADEEGKINLNTSNVRILNALFSGLGAAPADARGYVDKILDFRDFDHERRPGGGERAEYAEAADGHAPPKDGDFASVDELDQVLGLPRDLVAQMKPFVTTMSAQPGVDPSGASADLKKILRKGASGGFESSAAFDEGALPDDPLPSEFRSPSSRRHYSIHAEAALASGARYASEALVELPIGSSGNLVFRQWRRVPSQVLTSPQTAVSNLPPC